MQHDKWKVAFLCSFLFKMIYWANIKKDDMGKL